MNIENVKVKNLEYANEEKTIINMDVLFEGKEDYLPFAATEMDVEEHGKQLFRNAVEGKYGEIAPYSPSEEYIRFINTISFAEFRNRFTKEELIEVRKATMEIPELFVAWDDLQVAGSVVLVDQDVINNMNLFYTHKVFTKKRIGEILKTK